MERFLFNLFSNLCLLQDDLRKDARLMEFNGVVNKFLRKDPEARRRDLHIRTYVSDSSKIPIIIICKFNYHNMQIVAEFEFIA